MNPHSASLPRTRASRGYRLLLQLYPAAFRRRYEEEMLELFEQGWSRAQTGGAEGRARLGLRLAWDLVRTVPKERAAALAQPAGSAPLVLGAFLVSFFLPAYGTYAGWRCAAEVAGLGFHERNLIGFLVAWLATASNLGVPLLLVFLARSTLGSRLPRFTAWLTLLFAAAASYFLWDFFENFDHSHPLSSGFYLWWSCQIATFALVFWQQSARPIPVEASASIPEST
jgi:hypothetical protein